MRHGADVPDVVEDFARVAYEESGKLTIVVPGASDRAFVKFFAFFVEEERDGWHVGLGAIEADVALALLLGIIKGMRVKERPYELAADIFEAEFEMGVLINGVVPAVKRGGANVEALPVRYILGRVEWRW